MDTAQQDAEKAALWPETRRALIEGLKEVCQGAGISAYLRAQSEARLNGLHERAMGDRAWKAQAFLESVRCDWPKAPFTQVEFLELAGEKWRQIGPLVYEEWLFKLGSVKHLPNPFEESGRRGPSDDGAWSWLVCAGRVAREGWGPYEADKKGKLKKTEPLGEDLQARFAQVCLELRDAAVKRQSKGPGDDRFLKELQRVFGKEGEASALSQWGGWDCAMSSFEALILSNSVAKATRKSPAPRV